MQVLYLELFERIVPLFSPRLDAFAQTTMWHAKLFGRSGWTRDLRLEG